MRVVECEQGSAEWQQARLGIPTASQADRIITPKTRKASSQAVDYRNRLLAEWLTGFPMEPVTTMWMERGVELEPEARQWYSFQRDVEVEQVGFILRDDGLFGGSPDGLIGGDGVLEIKCPTLSHHVGYLIGDGPDHTGQVQSLMYLTGRVWADVVSYNPDLPPVVRRVERDEQYIADLVAVLDIFLADLAEKKEQLLPYRSEECSIVHPVTNQLHESLAQAVQ